jgi:hypothetical protein
MGGGGRNRFRRITRATTSGLSLLIVALVVGLASLGGRGAIPASAEEFEVTGTLSLSGDGAILVSDGATSYGLVSVIDLSPFVGTTPVLKGAADGDVLYVREVTLGDISVISNSGIPAIGLTGTVEEAKDRFQVTVEGIVFALIGSDQLDQVVGDRAHVEGQLTGTWITLTSLTTADGGIEIEPPAEDGLGEFPTEPDPYAWLDDLPGRG